jgi:sec-independent protein translocase protein TatC
LFDLLEKPYSGATGGEGALQGFNPTEAFSVAMRLSVFGGFVLASPVVFYQLWAFVNPALTKKERRWAIPVVAALVVLFLLGVAFAYWVLPRGLGFLLGIQPGVDTSNLRVGEYVSFVLRFLLVFGLAFEFPVFLFATAAAGLVTSAQLAKGRRWAVLAIVTIGAIVTPSGDPGTLFALAVPLYGFYEATIWLVKLVLRK